MIHDPIPKEWLEANQPDAKTVNVLVALLIRYGDHEEDCPARSEPYDDIHSGSLGRCDCGYAVVYNEGKRLNPIKEGD